MLLERDAPGLPRRRRRSTASDSRYYAELVRQGAATTSTPSRCAPTSLRRGPPGPARRHRPAVRARAGAGPAEDAGTWHDDGRRRYDVVLPTATRIGRIYLDLHPREGKFKHAAQFDLVRGVAGRQLAEGVLVCNFTRGLMEHDDVVTLFHEFGHLVHHVLAGRGRVGAVLRRRDRVGLRRGAEPDARGVGVGRRRAARPSPRNARRRGRSRPSSSPRCARADDFGKGYDARTQMFYASMSYWFHVDSPDDLTGRGDELQRRYSLFPLHRRHPHARAFGHLDGYCSGYYTYMWSLVIAKDMFRAFDRDDLFDARGRRPLPRPGARAGRPRDAADLVADFLGRPYTFDAYAAWLAE